MRVAIDFDGTLTDVEQEAGPYLLRFRELAAQDLNIYWKDLAHDLMLAKRLVLQDPTKGWTHNGYVVAPATADPYVFNTAIFTEFLAEMPQEKMQSLLFSWHTESYKSAATAFRTGAREFLEKATKEHDVTVVTNSKTDAVLQKLALLGFPNIPIEGMARKYVIDPSWDKVPFQQELPGFPRPVLLRRRHYGEILEKLKPDVVVGDIYELDLALPAHLGTRCVQLLTKGTPQYERAAHTPHVQVADNLENVLKKLR